MGTFVAKLKDDDQHWFKLKDNVQNEDYEEIRLDDTVIYDPNNTDRDQWFRIENFNEKEGFIEILEHGFDVADLETLSNEQFSRRSIEFIAFYHDRKFFIQKFTKGNYVRKKWFSWKGDAVEYFEEDGLVYISPEPNCIYDTQTKQIYFKDIAKAYSVFGALRLDYKEATDAETQQMLNIELVKTVDFSVSDVGVSNRKRITSILKKYQNYDQVKKNTLHQYIRDNVGENLVFDQADGKFVIKNDTDLKLLLYGIQQRFYQPPLEKEVQVATATTELSKIIKGEASIPAAG